MATSPRVSLSHYLYYIFPPSIAGVAYGWEVGSMGGILAMPSFLGYFDTPSSFTQGIMTAALIVGEFFGILLLGQLVADRLGRRKMTYLCTAIYLIGQVIVVAAQDRGMFIAGRVINGFGAGPLFQTISMYTAEITPAHVRGRTTASLNAGIAMGILVAYWVQYGALSIHGNGAWRMCFALQLVPGAAVGIIMAFRPESPRWLVSKGREDDAAKVLASVHANGDIYDPAVKTELDEIKIVARIEGIEAPSYYSLLLDKRYRRRTFLACGLQICQQLSGANIVLYYAAKVFAQTGRTGASAALLANGISSSLLLVGTCSLTALTDWYGRRFPIVAGPAIMGVCLVVVGSILVSYGSPHFDQITQSVQFTFQNVGAGNSAIAFMLLFEFFFGALSSSLPWTYQNEVFPLSARARGTSMSTAANYFTNFWLGLYIPDALNSASWRVYYIFGALNLAISVLGYLFYPETVDKTLEELDLLFTAERSVFVFLDKDARSRSPFLETYGESAPEALGARLADQLGVKLGEDGNVHIDGEKGTVSTDCVENISDADAMSVERPIRQA